MPFSLFSDILIHENVYINHSYYGNIDIKLYVQFIGLSLAEATAIVPQPEPPQSHDDLSPFSSLAREKNCST